MIFEFNLAHVFQSIKNSFTYFEICGNQGWASQGPVLSLSDEISLKTLYPWMRRAQVIIEMAQGTFGGNKVVVTE